jgi:hypothetical protein
MGDNHGRMDGRRQNQTARHSGRVAKVIRPRVSKEIRQGVTDESSADMVLVKSGYGPICNGDEAHKPSRAECSGAVHAGEGSASKARAAAANSAARIGRAILCGDIVL